MSNTTCRPHGIAKRALALLTAIALATTLTPNFAFAGEANNLASITAEQNPTAGSASSPSTADSAANKADATQDVSESQASGSSSAAGHATTSSSKANASESAEPVAQIKHRANPRTLPSPQTRHPAPRQIPFQRH